MQSMILFLLGRNLDNGWQTVKYQGRVLRFYKKQYLADKVAAAGGAPNGTGAGTSKRSRSLMEDKSSQGRVLKASKVDKIQNRPTGVKTKGPAWNALLQSAAQSCSEHDFPESIATSLGALDEETLASKR